MKTYILLLFLWCYKTDVVGLLILNKSQISVEMSASNRKQLKYLRFKQMTYKKTFQISKLRCRTLYINNESS